MTARNQPPPVAAGTKTTPWAGWSNVVVAALLMAGTLPARTQGLGLITEPLLRDLQLDHVLYANLNLWATLLGAVLCLPAGWIFDRYGLRWPSAIIVLLLGIVVWRMSLLTGNVAGLFGLLLLSRALGQSALSVASITTVGKAFGQRVGLAMGVYAVLLSIFFALGFLAIGSVVRQLGWRQAWLEVALVLLLGIVPLTLCFLRESIPAPAQLATIPAPVTVAGLPLSDALREPAFWVFAGATALFGLASSGLGLFNEAVLAERGFDQKAFHHFLVATTLVALLGQMMCGWLTLRWPMARLLAIAMILYALGLAALPFISAQWHLWLGAAFIGGAGGMIAVLFFAIWSHAFGRAQLGRIQGAAQTLTVFASAVGPLLFASCHARFQSYTPALWLLTAGALVLALAAWCVKLPVVTSAPLPPGAT